MVYIVLKYYCVLITNSHVLSIALYEFRQPLLSINMLQRILQENIIGALIERCWNTQL